MFGTSSCDELRGYLDVKVPSSARKKGLLIYWKAWRRQWLVVRRFLVSSDPSLVNGDEVAIIGRRLEVRLTGGDGSYNRNNNVSAPCPVVVVEEWQEDALVCPTKSQSHPYAFGLFPQPGCEPILFLSGRTAEESRRWLASIRSLLVPPFRPHSFRLSSLSNSPGEDVKMPLQHSSPFSSSPETYRSSTTSSKYHHICFPPLPPLPSRCRLHRRSSVESLGAPGALTDRRRSLSDSEITSTNSNIHRHRHHKCQRSIDALDPEIPTNETSLSDDYDHHHIYAGIADSGVCCSMSNHSRSCLSSSSSSCSSSSGLYAYATTSLSNFTSYLRGNSKEECAGANLHEPSQSKLEEPSLLGGKVASSLISAGFGLMLSTPVPLDGVSELPCLSSQNKEVEETVDESGSQVCVPCKDEGEMDMDRRESIASGIYEEIKEDQQAVDISREDKSSALNEQNDNSLHQSPPPLPPRSPSQFYTFPTGRQRDLAWFLGVHRHSNSCPASDCEDDESSRESSPIDGQDNVKLRKPRRKISEPSGLQLNNEESGTTTIGYSKRRKNLESFLGVMEFGSKTKDISKSGVSFLNKSLGALELSGMLKGERDSIDKVQEWKSRERTYTDSAGMQFNNFVTNVQKTNRCSSADALLTKVGRKLTDRSPEVLEDINLDATSVVLDYTRINESSVGVQNGDSILEKVEMPEIELEKESCPSNKVNISPSPKNSDILDVKKSILPIIVSTMESCHSFSCSSLKRFQSDKIDNQDRNSQSSRSPSSISKRLQWMKPSNTLMRLLSKEQNKQQELPSLKNKTKQVINRSLETLGWLGLATSQTEDDSNVNLKVGGSNFYRSATCTGVDMQNERHNALRRGAGRYCNDENSYSKSYESSTVGRARKRSPTISINDETWAREIGNTDSEQTTDISTTPQFLEDSAICPYHRSCLEESGEVIGQTLGDIERLAKQELICEQYCMGKETNESNYIPMGPLITKEEKEQQIIPQFSCSQTDFVGQPHKRVSVVPEEDHYMSMEGVTTPSQDRGKKAYQKKEPLSTNVKLENSANHLVYTNDGDIYMSMEGMKSTQEELAQR